jgi:hypothetical protein
MDGNPQNEIGFVDILFLAVRLREIGAYNTYSYHFWDIILAKLRDRTGKNF